MTQPPIGFDNLDEFKRWLGTQRRDVGVALAARSALRVFPMIGQPAGGLLLSDERILQARFRALSVPWIACSSYSGDRRLRIPARAAQAAAGSLPIGTFATNPAASAAQRSAAQAVRALAGTGQNSYDAIFAAISEAFSAEAGFLDVARCVWALDQDIEFLSGGNPSFLASVPLWLNQPPTWAQQKWQALKTTLHNAGKDWQVWTIWYDDRLDGRVRSIEREVAYVDMPDELWRQGPEAVNASIVRRIEEHEPPPQPILRPELPTGDQSTIVSENKPVPDFSNAEDVRRWLADKPREVAIVIAARTALRVAPLLDYALGSRGGSALVGRNIVLPAFRALAAPWVASRYPTHGAEIGDAAARAVAGAAHAAAYAAAYAAAARAAGAASATTIGHAYAAATDAITAAATAAATDAADAAATATVTAAAAADAQFIDQGGNPSALASRPLWLTEAPTWAREAWLRLEQALLTENRGWKVWTDWYRARLEGGRAIKALEVARVMIADEIWTEGPRAVNAEIARLIEDHRRRESEQSSPVEYGITDGPHLPLSHWADTVAAFKEGSKIDQDQARRLSAALAASGEERIEHYSSIFMAGGNAPRRILISRSLADRYPELAERLNAEQNRVLQLIEDRSPPGKIEPRAARNWDFFLSYSGDDVAFAHWTNDVLSAAGFQVFAQFNDMPPGSNFVREMQRGLARSARFIALLSPAYQGSDHCQAEWSAAYNADPGGQKRKLVPFLISPTQLDPLAKQIVYKPLVGLSALDAAKAVLEGVGYQGLPAAVPPGWPGGAAIDRMQAATGGVYEVAPGSDLRLERMPSAVNDSEEGGHTPEQLFADAVSVVVRFSSYVERHTGNYRCSERLSASVRNLSRIVTAVDVRQCDYLGFNRELVWALRMIALDSADGLIPRNEEIEYHASDLVGVYNRLERIFPRLRPYRKMEARDRFQLPGTDVENAIRSVCRSFGNPEIAGDALSPELSEELKQAGEGIDNAKKLAETESVAKTLDINVESHTDAATRSLAVWGWLSNASDRLVKAGKKAEDVEKAIEGYEKLYGRLAPHMVRYIGYLLKWFF